MNKIKQNAYLENQSKFFLFEKNKDIFTQRTDI